MYRLGKLAPKVDDRTLQYAKYVGTALPAAPASLNYSAKVANWPMLANDKFGDCTCAGIGHMIETWTGNVGQIYVPTVAEVLYFYQITGPTPNLPVVAGSDADDGRVEIDCLNEWRNVGFGDKKDKIIAYMSVNPKLKAEVKQASWLFGGLYLGIALPISAQNQTGEGKIWRTATGANGEPGSWGGHAVPVVDYDSSTITIVTWGALQKMTWAFFAKYVDEAYAVLSPDWFAKSGALTAPNGFNLSQLQTDLNAIT